MKIKVKVICDCHNICDNINCSHSREHKHTPACDLECATLYKINRTYFSNCKTSLKTIRKEKLKKLNYVRKK